MIQIFGIKKDSNTRKALRFFSERRIQTQFVDFKVRAASVGELKRFAQKFGVDSLIDRESKRFGVLGWQAARYSDERWLQLLSEEPLVLRMPLVRNGNQLTIGAAEDQWRDWTT